MDGIVSTCLRSLELSNNENVIYVMSWKGMTIIMATEGLMDKGRQIGYGVFSLSTAKGAIAMVAVRNHCFVSGRASGAWQSSDGLCHNSR